MKISVNIRVRNPQWYWTKEELRQSKMENSISREEWEMINENKIFKHSHFIDFEYDFEVKSFSERRDGNFNLLIKTSENEKYEDPIEKIIPIEDVTVVEFIGDTKKGYVVVSNDLVHQFISAQKGKDGRFYWYFYIKENVLYDMFSENIWLSDIQLEYIDKQLGNINRKSVYYSIDKDENIKLRSIGDLSAI